MTKFIFVAVDGGRVEIDAATGVSAMMAAVTNGVDGIVADCGGSLACGTCHVYVAPAGLERLPAPSEMERDMLTMTATPARANSRLSCQLLASAEIGELVMHLPERQ